MSNNPPDWETPEVIEARYVLTNDIPPEESASLNLRQARRTGRRGAPRERRIDLCLGDLVWIYRRKAEATVALINARRAARGEPHITEEEIARYGPKYEERNRKERHEYIRRHRATEEAPGRTAPGGAGARGDQSGVGGAPAV